MKILYCKGAYGRIAHRVDWDNGKDFQVVNNGPYFSKRDVDRLKKDGYTHVHAYNRIGIEFIVDLEK